MHSFCNPFDRLFRGVCHSGDDAVEVQVTLDGIVIYHLKLNLRRGKAIYRLLLCDISEILQVLLAIGKRIRDFFRVPGGAARGSREPGSRYRVSRPVLNRILKPTYAGEIRKGFCSASAFEKAA